MIDQTDRRIRDLVRDYLRGAYRHLDSVEQNGTSFPLADDRKAAIQEGNYRNRSSHYLRERRRFVFLSSAADIDRYQTYPMTKLIDPKAHSLSNNRR